MSSEGRMVVKEGFLVGSCPGDVDFCPGLSMSRETVEACDGRFLNFGAILPPKKNDLFIYRNILYSG